MPNKLYAKEWLQFAYRNLHTAARLYEVDHYTDIIVVDLQQAIEKILKSLLAYNNKKIPRSHFLDELASLQEEISFDEDEMSILEKTTDFYREDRYPNPNYVLPTKSETKEILDFANLLFEKTFILLGISKDEIIGIDIKY